MRGGELEGELEKTLESDPERGEAGGGVLGGGVLTESWFIASDGGPATAVKTSGVAAGWLAGAVGAWARPGPAGWAVGAKMGTQETVGGKILAK